MGMIVESAQHYRNIIRCLVSPQFRKVDAGTYDFQFPDSLLPGKTSSLICKSVMAILLPCYQ
jgi:hypothetical protein